MCCADEHLDDDRVPREDGCRDRVEDVMKRIVPRNNRPQNPARMPLDARNLVNSTG